MSFYDYLIIVAALMTSRYLHSIIFCLFKANKYENLLAKKIAEEVKKTLKE